MEIQKCHGLCDSIIRTDCRKLEKLALPSSIRIIFRVDSTRISCRLAYARNTIDHKCWQIQGLLNIKYKFIIIADHILKVLFTYFAVQEERELLEGKHSASISPPSKNINNHSVWVAIPLAEDNVDSHLMYNSKKIVHTKDFVVTGRSRLSGRTWNGSQARSSLRLGASHCAC